MVAMRDKANMALPNSLAGQKTPPDPTLPFVPILQSACKRLSSNRHRGAVHEHRCAENTIQPPRLVPISHPAIPHDRNPVSPSYAQMPLLPNIESDYVHRGWWRNLTAPAYRQWLWTGTNMEVVVYLGLLGILGTIAGDKLWPILRHFLQPAVQLSDAENKRIKLSRNDAIKAIWAEIKYVKKDLKMIWSEEYGIWPKIKMSLATMSGDYHQPLRPLATTIEVRFGVFAILNIVSLFILGVFIPFFLAEGLQGETIVQGIQNFQAGFINFQVIQTSQQFQDLQNAQKGIKGFQRSYYLTRQYALTNEGVRGRVSEDFKTCLTDSGVWIQTDYCLELRNTLPPYKAEDLNLTDLIFDEPPYRFLLEKGDANFKALRLSQNISLQDVAFNTKPGRKKLLHELTCVPVSLDQFINQVNGSFELRVEDLIPSSIPHSRYEPFPFVIHDSMILKTSNAVGSGHDIYESKTIPMSTGVQAHTEPVHIHGDQRATWYQTEVDATLPWIEFKGPATNAMKSRALLAASMVRGERGLRLQNFLITFKPGEWYGVAKSPSDDPIFGAHRSSDAYGYVADREILALGCAEVFKICSADQCTEPPLGEFDEFEGIIDPNAIGFESHKEGDIDGWLDLCYPGIMSIWLSTLIDPTYGDAPPSGALRNFLSHLPNHRQRWQDDVEERFIRSMLRVRYASTYAAEQDLVNPDVYNAADYWVSDPLLYRNSDYTNINVLGTVATAGAFLYIIAARYWLVLLSTLILPLKFLLWTASTGLEKFKALIIFGRIWIRVAGSAIRNLIRAGNLLRRRRPLRSNTFQMDTWYGRQESDEPDNPLRMARNQGTWGIV